MFASKGINFSERKPLTLQPTWTFPCGSLRNAPNNPAFPRKGLSQRVPPPTAPSLSFPPLPLPPCPSLSLRVSTPSLRILPTHSPHYPCAFLPRASGLGSAALKSALSFSGVGRGGNAGLPLGRELEELGHRPTWRRQQSSHSVPFQNPH